MTFNAGGLGTALVTPFHKDGSIDFKGFEKLINHVIEGGGDYLVPLGTTGESVTLSKDEKIAVTDFVIEVVDKRKPIVLGLGGNNTREILDQINKQDFSAISAILSVAPYYNKPSQRGFFEHYKAIANVCPVPVILYNVPGRTGSNMAAETTLQIAKDVENVLGIKEASGNLEQCMMIVAKKPKNFQLISGDDILALPMIAAGATGLISVASNAFAPLVAEMVKYCLKGQMDKARSIHYKLLPLMQLMFAEGNPAGIKAMLSEVGVCNSCLRLPLVGVSKATQSAINAAMKNLD